MDRASFELIGNVGKLEIKPVKWIDEVLEIALERSPQVAVKTAAAPQGAGRAAQAPAGPGFGQEDLRRQAGRQARADTRTDQRPAGEAGVER